MQNYLEMFLQISLGRTIYGRNGSLLAYDELAYAVTITDEGFYDSQKECNQTLNNVISQAIELIEENGNTVENGFPITYTELGSYIFSEEGASLQRLRADVFGYRDVEDLSYNSLCQLRSHIINRMFCYHRNCTKCWVTK